MNAVAVAQKQKTKTKSRITKPKKARSAPALPKIVIPKAFDTKITDLGILREKLQNQSIWRADKKYLISHETNLFAKNVSDELRDQLLLTAFLHNQTIFQILTPHPEKTLKYLTAKSLSKRLKAVLDTYLKSRKQPLLFDSKSFALPLKNVWIGVQPENQKHSLTLRPALAEIAAKGWRTFAMQEPVVSPVVWTEWKFLSWLVLGGDGENLSYPIHPNWLKNAKDFCRKNKIPFFFKGWGEWMPKKIWDSQIISETKRWNSFEWGVVTLPGDFHQYSLPTPMRSRDECLVLKVGKKYAGDKIDEISYKQYPL